MQYADDTMVFLRDEKSVEQLLRLRDKFRSMSGLEINNSKTQAMWLGCWRDRTCKPFNFKWPKESICAIGIYFSCSTEHADKLKFEGKIKIPEKNSQWLETEKTHSTGKDKHC